MSKQAEQVQARQLLREAGRLLRSLWPLVLFATATGILSGLATAWLLATINDALHSGEGAIWPLLVRFAALAALAVSGTAIAGILNSIMGQRIIASLRKDISARILRAPIAALEAHRPYRLMSVLTDDVDTISAFTFNFSGYAIAAAVTLGSFVYLLTLSGVVFAIALASLIAGLAINIVAERGWVRHYTGVRAAQDELHKQYRAIIDGAKELKISRPRRARVHGMLLAGAADSIAALKSRAMGLFWLADAAGAAIAFIVIGLLLAGRHRLGIDASVISGAVIVLLYVKGPIAQLSAALPALDQALISFKRVAELSVELEQHDPNMPIASMDASTEPDFQSIELRGVTYAFPTPAGAEPFVLGPIDLLIRAGEMTFIVGENGSGKTTLIKLLLGLYEPQSGTVLLNGEPVTPATRDDYRQLFATVFSDYYLFDDLVYGEVLAEKANPYLERLGIADKVHAEQGRLSTTDLSAGQRKRIALMHAYLEPRPIIVTDEWAADQDPEFRRIFYEELLPELKAAGRTLIVITHDDRYFGVADRLIRMENGKIVADESLRPASIGMKA